MPQRSATMPGDSATVAEILRRQARSRPHQLLLVCDDDRISYAAADHRSAELARGLIGLGAGKGTHVGLLYPNGIEFVVAMLAAARIGAVVVPFSTFATAREMREQLVDSDVDDPVQRRIVSAPTTICDGWARSFRMTTLILTPRCSLLPHRNCDMSWSTTSGSAGWRGPSTPRWWRRWKTTSTDRTHWRSCTPRVPPAPRREWCTHTPACWDTSRTSTGFAA